MKVIQTATSHHSRSFVREARAVHQHNNNNVDKIINGVSAAIMAVGVAMSPPALAGSVAFTNVESGATVSTPVTLNFAVEGMEVRPAGEGLKEGTGHFHVIIDSEEDYAPGVAIPFDKTHLHFGKGQTTANIPLDPGSHTLSLQFANALHESYGPEYLQKIVVKAE